MYSDIMADYKLTPEKVHELSLRINKSEQYIYDWYDATYPNLSVWRDAAEDPGNHSDEGGGVRMITDLPGVQAFFYMLYLIILITGITGNFLVIFIVYRNKAMLTVTNVFITNLAASDMLMCALAVPFTPLSSFLPEWIFGAALCHIVPLIQGLSVFVSTMTLTVIAIDRYIVILFPLRPRMKLLTCLLVILTIWGVSVVILLPLAIFMDIQPDENNPELHFCQEAWPHPESKEIYTMVIMIVQYVVPFLIITYCYVCVSLRLSARVRYKPGASKRKEEIEIKRKKRLNRMLIAMVVIFACSWFPFNMVHITTDYIEPDMLSWEYYTVVFFTAHVIAMSSTCYNPFLYAWLNETFRKEFKKILPCFRKSRDRNIVPPVGGKGCTCMKPVNSHSHYTQHTLGVTTGVTRTHAASPVEFTDVGNAHQAEDRSNLIPEDQIRKPQVGLVPTSDSRCNGRELATSPLLNNELCHVAPGAPSENQLVPSAVASPSSLRHPHTSAEGDDVTLMSTCGSATHVPPSSMYISNDANPGNADVDSDVGRSAEAADSEWIAMMGKQPPHQEEQQVLPRLPAAVDEDAGLLLDEARV